LLNADLARLDTADQEHVGWW